MLSVLCRNKPWDTDACATVDMYLQWVVPPLLAQHSMALVETSSAGIAWALKHAGKGLAPPRPSPPVAATHIPLSRCVSNRAKCPSSQAWSWTLAKRIMSVWPCAWRRLAAPVGSSAITPRCGVPCAIAVNAVCVVRSMSNAIFRAPTDKGGDRHVQGLEFLPPTAMHEPKRVVSHGRHLCYAGVPRHASVRAWWPLSHTVADATAFLPKPEGLLAPSNVTRPASGPTPRVQRELVRGATDACMCLCANVFMTRHKIVSVAHFPSEGPLGTRQRPTCAKSAPRTCARAAQHR